MTTARPFLMWIAVGCSTLTPRSPPAKAPPAPPEYDGITTCGPIMTPSPPVVGYVGDIPQGSLDKNLIQRPIKARSAEIRACYEHALAARPELEGTVHAKFAIVATGKVTSVEISGFDRELDECICNEMLQLRYPQFGSARFGTITVMYPFAFRRQPAFN